MTHNSRAGGVRSYATLKVILSHPFSGALYWWFATLAGAPEATARLHPYYRALHDRVEENLDVALGCAVIFDDIIIPAADASFPADTRRSAGATISALAISTNWDATQEAYSLLAEHQQALLQDASIRATLRDLEPEAKNLGLLYAITDILLTAEHGAPVVCSSLRRRLIGRLLELGIVPSARPEQAETTQAMADTLETYTEVMGLTFLSESVEELGEVKWDHEIRSYAESFQQALTAPSADGTSRLFESIQEAWEGAEAAGHVAGAFSSVATALDAVSLIPGVGTATGAVALGSDLAARTAERRGESLRWFELSNRIQRYESLRRLRAKCAPD